MTEEFLETLEVIITKAKTLGRKILLDTGVPSPITVYCHNCKTHQSFRFHSCRKINGYDYVVFYDCRVCKNSKVFDINIKRYKK